MSTTIDREFNGVFFVVADIPTREFEGEACASLHALCQADRAIASAALREKAVTPDIVRFARKSLGMTRDVLAMELEVAAITIESIESGAWVVTPEYVGRLRALITASDRGGFVARRVP